MPSPGDRSSKVWENCAFFLINTSNIYLVNNTERSHNFCLCHCESAQIFPPRVQTSSPQVKEWLLSRHAPSLIVLRLLRRVGEGGVILLSRVKSDQYVTDRLHQTVIDSRGGSHRIPIIIILLRQKQRILSIIHNPCENEPMNQINTRIMSPCSNKGHGF